MFRLLFLLVVGFGIYALWLHIQKLKNQTTTTSVDNIEPMVKCQHCGIYTPQKTSIKGTNDQWYCCSAHEQQTRK